MKRTAKGWQGCSERTCNQANSQDPACTNTKTKEGSKKCPTENSQKLGHEPEGSDSEACNTFKIPDVPKPNTGADDVADWAAEVIHMRIRFRCQRRISARCEMVV